MGLGFRPYTVFNKRFENPYIRRIRNPFNDIRFANTHEKLSSRLIATQKIAIQKLGEDVNMANRFYHFLGSDRVRVEELIRMTCMIEPEIVKNRSVLHIGDTTMYNMSKHVGRINDVDQLGVLQDMKTPGFYLHAGLAVDTFRRQFNQSLRATRGIII